MQICEKQKCTGCFACINVCPKQCIATQEDEMGHIYPVIDKQLCINCNLCKKVCPVNEKPDCVKPLKTFAAYSLDEDEHRKSSSGGVATAFSRKVIEAGGVVYGASSKFSDKIEHIRVENIEELEFLQGSKYVHSRIGESYSYVKKDLQNGRKVLFIGTPCQIAGLKNFLKVDNENLITVDLICHGVPSQKLLNDCVGKYKSPNSKISFRNSKGYSLEIKDIKENKLQYQKSLYKNFYYIGFMKSLYFRDSCYTCNYAKAERCSDFTIGDFWGLNKNNVRFKHKDGVSVVLINTSKGKAFWRNAKNDFYYEERSFEEAYNGNVQLRRPSVAHPKREAFKKAYIEKGFNTAFVKTMFQEIVKYRVLNIIKKNKFIMKCISKSR